MPTTNSVLTMADLQANRFQSAAEFGLSTIAEVLQRDLDAHNQIVRDMVGGLCEVGTDRQRIYGTSAEGEFEEGDEFDRGVSMKNIGGSTVGFPLRPFPRALTWTRNYFLNATPADIAESMVAIQQAHIRVTQRTIKRALFGGVNYTFRDRLVSPSIDLAVKALVNADGAPIPNGPNGETFDGATHTHYDYLNATAPTQAAALDLINDVLEHGHGTRMILAIPLAAEATVKQFAEFERLVDPRITLLSADAPRERLDITRMDNRMIGLLGAAEVWVKSWVPSGYLVAYDAGGVNKPLFFREHPNPQLRGLRIAAELDEYPLYARQMESFMGVGAWTRTAAAVLYYASGASAYVAPTL